ncbi:hypothetical protein J2847_005807 [Azospirillum agricola]|uniref:hypothetical protein n=1 Tax=Azospirillum agricola TaxID=1720247 RepID=UPI001AEAC3D6|nr:hypothetical protein [Azospirillum agricola]MBP2232478.1 hypothetical protein [Azospirillum agricola]
MKFNPALPARTRSGLPVRIISTDRRDSAFPITALYDDGTGEGVLCLRADGCCSELPDGVEEWPAAGNPNDVINIVDGDPVMVEAARLYTEAMAEVTSPVMLFDALAPHQKAPYMHKAAKALKQCPDIQTIASVRLPASLKEATDHLLSRFGHPVDSKDAAAFHKLLRGYRQLSYALTDSNELLRTVCQAPTMSEGYAALEDWCASCGHPQPIALPGVIGDVVAERRRQIEVEGNTLEQDDGYTMGELARAAISYIKGFPEAWPWAIKWWKPKDARRNLIRALALLVAEVERQDRAKVRSARAEG